MKHLCPIAVLFLALLFISGCERPPPSPTPSGLTIKIGVIAPDSGPDAEVGKSSVRGIEIARRLTPYLANGDRVELVIEDDHSDPERTVAALESLAGKHAVAAVLLLSGSNSAIAAARIADRYQTPVLVTNATNPGVTSHSELVSQLIFDDTLQATVAAMFVRDELFIQKVAVFSNPDSAYSSHLARVFKDKFTAVGGRITDFIELPPSTTGFDDNSLLDEIRADKPELLYMPTHAGFIIGVSRQLHNLDWSPEIMSAEGFFSTVVSRYADDLHLASGILTTALYTSDMQLSSYGKRLAEYVHREDVDTYMLTGMEGYALLLNAINRCDTPAERQCINRNIRSTDNFTGIADSISIGADGKAHRALFVNRIDGDEMNTVVKVN